MENKDFIKDKEYIISEEMQDMIRNIIWSIEGLTTNMFCCNNIMYAKGYDLEKEKEELFTSRDSAIAYCKLLVSILEKVGE